MKKFITLTFVAGLLAFSTTSCSQYGCPGQFGKEFQFDKSLKAGDVLVSNYQIDECIN